MSPKLLHTSNNIVYFAAAPSRWFRPSPFLLSRKEETMCNDHLVCFLAILAVLVFGSYWLPKLLVSLLPVPDLKKKYGAQWALVTGSSSGIGKSLAIKLAQQGVNVVLVALQEDILDETFAELQAQFKTRKFIKIGVNLGTPGYLDKIDEATKGVDVQLVFNNAGFMLTGFFDKQCVFLQGFFRTFFRASPTDMFLV